MEKHLRARKRIEPTKYDGDCLECGAGDREWVMRFKGDWKKWRLCDSPGERMDGYRYPQLCKVGSDGICNACRAIKTWPLDSPK